MFCPQCGAEVAEVREAHHVGATPARPVRKPMVWPTGRVVLWPCGHLLARKVVEMVRSQT